MSETTQNQDGQKTIVAFIVGLLIGGLIVWMFSGSPTEAPTANGLDQDAPAEENGENGHNDSDDDVAETDAATPTPGTNEQAGTSRPAPTMEVGDGSVTVTDQPASNRVALEAVTYPMSDGWIGVRDYVNGNLGGLLGVVRFSESEGLVPEEIILQRATEAGREYAIVFYTPGETNEFNLAVNAQVDGIFATFVAR